MATQLVYPNPNIWCRPGWCLQYVREAFGIYPGVRPTAMAGWNASPTKHRDRNFPAGKWIPLWFSLRNVPAGHVALMAPNGNVYSTSDDSNTPHCHPDLDDLLNYYNRYGQPITYLGWTEDIEGVTVVDLGSASLGYDGEIVTTPTESQEDTLSAAEVQQINDHTTLMLNQLALDGQLGGRTRGGMADVADKVADVWAWLRGGESGKRVAGPIPAMLAAIQGQNAGLLEALKQATLAPGSALDLEAVKEASKAGAAEALAGLEATATTTVTLNQEGH